jgi:5'-nucleotidase / UDP-sugar diphosphatase
LAWLIAQRKAARGNEGPVLVLDAGDYSMGTAFGAATRETGCELQLMSHMGYDATTFGNYDFDFGPAGLAKSIDVATKAGRFSPVVASNTNFAGTDPTLADLQRLAREDSPPFVKRFMRLALRMKVSVESGVWKRHRASRFCAWR